MTHPRKTLGISTTGATGRSMATAAPAAANARVLQASFPGGQLSPIVRGWTAGRSVVQGAAFPAPPSFLRGAAAGGQPLPVQVQGKMASFFETDFSQVRVHVGPQAAAIGALAFTVGNDLYFAPGQYQPHTERGQRLLGHELAHVVQQARGRVTHPYGNGLAIVHDPALEDEADAMGALAARHTGRGHRPPPGHGAAGHAGGAPEGAIVQGSAIFDHLVTENRRHERELARQVFSALGVRAQLRNAFARLQARLGGNALLNVEGRYGYDYTTIGERLSNWFARQTVNQGIAKIQAEIVAGHINNDELYSWIIAALVGTSRTLRRDIRTEVTAPHPHLPVGPMPGEAVQDVTMANVGYAFRIVGVADTLRHFWSRKNTDLGLHGFGPAGRNAIYYPNQGNPWKFNSANGPSATTMEVLNLAKYLGCSATELRAIAWGLFAWWRTHTRARAYHTFQETMVVLNAYLNEQFYTQLPAAPQLGARPVAPGGQPPVLGPRFL